MTEIEIKIKKTVIRLIQFLVEQNYSEIADWSKNTRLTADEIKEALDDYASGRKVIIPPTDFFNAVNFMQIIDADDGRKQWYVAFNLWFEQEGKSDLTVESTFIESAREYFDIEIDNIHTM